MDKTIPELAYDYASKRPDKVIDRPSPSQLGGCMRAHYYKIKHIPVTTPPNPGAILNFEVGFMWEAQVTNWLRSAGIPFIEQYSMHDTELNLSGTLDFAPFDPKTGVWEVWDSKTEGMMANTYRKRQKKSFFEAHPEYAMQLCCYAIMLDRQNFTVGKGRFAVIVKDNGLVYEDLVGFTPDLRKKTLDRLARLNLHLETNTVPDCECEDWKVGYCDYGNPATTKENSTKKMVNTECCPTIDVLEQWANA